MTHDRVGLELVARAAEAFRKWHGTLPTGAEGLSRKDLRSLERAGLISRSQKKLPSGVIVNIWRWEAK